MGVELLFFDGMLSNQGDFSVDLNSWPSGLEAAGKRIKAAGLQVSTDCSRTVTAQQLNQFVAIDIWQVGLHMIDTGAQTCHGSHGTQPNGTQSSCAAVTVEKPDIFVPQGLAPRDWFYPQTAGTWYCHEMSGTVCQDQTRIQCDSHTPLLATDPHPGGCCRPNTPGCGGKVTPPPNNIELYGAVDSSRYWCRLGAQPYLYLVSPSCHPAFVSLSTSNAQNCWQGGTAQGERSALMVRRCMVNSNTRTNTTSP